MSNYLKLVNFELNRFIKLYMVLIGVTIVSQLVGAVLVSRRYLKDVNQAIYEDGMSQSSFIEQFGQFSFYDFGMSLWFVGPIALSIVVLLIYVFFIWYRDWFAKNTFIYRLLTLPTARLNVYLSKATTIFLMVLGLVALQLILIPIESRVLEWMVPLDFRNDLSLDQIIEQLHVMSVLIPQSILQFIRNFGIGFMSVFIVFTAILLERSFKWKGILLGILYGAFTIGLYVLPGVLESLISPGYFYQSEKFFIAIAMVVIISSLSIWLGRLLLKYKVTV
ncbi:hypothetical protein KQI49_12470 [Virgibacillus sp. MSJ-26]|uniref:hypothetical protein n=1 Tax=Virgibacillus sp. MSJ-26 TaxID=2841522 RepID=UPI001C10B791|nr:hypothetical protein [Virgibacillus sp. MSJ-26]MBU5467633.1 hypothetical protein [Virgibacillus sp. MSJ-26]